MELIGNNAPTILKGVEQQVKEMAALEETLLREDWEFTEDHKDGFSVTYGMQDGVAYAYGKQKDISDFIEYCSLKRQNEADMGLMKRNAMGLREKWILPPVIKFDLEARGYPVDDMVKSGNTYELDIIVEREFPQFKCTNLMLTKGKRK